MRGSRSYRSVGERGGNNPLYPKVLYHIITKIKSICQTNHQEEILLNDRLLL